MDVVAADRYTLVPVNVRPDVPHYVNQALGEIGRDMAVQILRLSGTVDLAKDTATGLAALEALDLITGDDVRIPMILPAKPGWEHVDVDGLGNVVFGLRTDGTYYFRSIDAPGLLSADDPRLPVELSRIPGWEHVDVDGAGNVIAGLRTDGTHYFRGDSAAADGADLPAKIAVFGDSMAGDHGGTKVSIASALAAALGVEVHGGGVPGQTSTEVALRQGGLDVFITVDAGSIPASGAVPCTVVQPAGVWKTGSAWTFPGTLAGVPGTLAKSAADAWTFTRTASGTAVACPPETRWKAAAADKNSWVQIFRSGRNAVNAPIIARDERAMVAGLAGSNNRFLVLPTYNTTSEPAGSAGYVKVMAINAEREATWGANYYDLRGWLIRHGLTTAGITATAADTTAIAEDRIPPSLLLDGTHLTAQGRTIEAARLAHILTAKEWI